MRVHTYSSISLLLLLLELASGMGSLDRNVCDAVSDFGHKFEFQGCNVLILTGNLTHFCDVFQSQIIFDATHGLTNRGNLYAKTGCLYVITDSKNALATTTALAASVRVPRTAFVIVNGTGQEVAEMPLSIHVLHATKGW